MSIDFARMSINEVKSFIFEKKHEIGNKLCIVGYPFQFQDLIEIADFKGDAEKIMNMSLFTKSQFIMFTGWRFFAEIPLIFGSEKTIIPVRDDLSCKDMTVTDLPHLANCLEPLLHIKKEEEI